MRSVLTILRNLLQGPVKSTAGRNRPVRKIAGIQLIADSPEERTLMQCELIQAGRRLRAMEQLLIQPTPEAIREATMLLEEANLLVKRFLELANASPGQDAQTLRQKVQVFSKLCQRVGALLEGARRVQWTRMHSIASFTQSYTRGAKLKTWVPTCRTLNVEM